MRKAVAGAHHKGIEGIFGVEQRQRIAGRTGLQRLEAVLELLVTIDLHRQGAACRRADRLLNLAHIAAGSHLLHHGTHALQQQDIPHQRAGLESRFNPGAVTDTGHLLLQNFAGAFPQLLSLHHGAFNLPFVHIIQSLLWSVIHNGFFQRCKECGKRPCGKPHAPFHISCIIIADTDTFDKSPLFAPFCIGGGMLKTLFPTHGGRMRHPPQNMALDKLNLYIYASSFV